MLSLLLERLIKSFNCWNLLNVFVFVLISVLVSYFLIERKNTVFSSLEIVPNGSNLDRIQQTSIHANFAQEILTQALKLDQIIRIDKFESANFKYSM